MPAAFKAQKRRRTGVGWGMVICWMEVFSRPPENSQALVLGSLVLDPSPRNLGPGQTGLSEATLFLPLSVSQGHGRGGRAEEQ